MKSLGAILRALSLSEQQRIAAAWGIVPPTSDDLDETMQIERLMRDPIAARTFWNQLGADERSILQAMLGPSARNWCLVETLGERIGLSQPLAERALQRLTQRFIIATEIARVQGNELIGQRTAFYGFATTRSHDLPILEKMIAYVPTEIATTLYTVGRELNPLFPDRTTIGVDELLLPYRQGDLDQIGRRFGLSLQVYCSRNDARLAIAENVSQAEAVHYALGQIGQPLNDSYQWLLARGGRATVAELQRHLRRDLPGTLQALRTFEDYAIAFDAFSDGERVIFIPARTFDNLRRASARPRQEVGLRHRPVPPYIRPADSLLLWDIAAFVAAIAQNEIELIRSGALPKRVAQRILPTIQHIVTDDDESALRALAQLQYEVTDLGLVHVNEVDGHARLELGAGLETWATQDVRMQTHRLIHRWPQSRTWNDRFGARFESWYASYLHVPRSRELLLKMLENCEPGVWYDLQSLLLTIHGDDPFVLRPSQRYNGQSGFKMTDEIRAHWLRTDGELLIGMLSSTLHELGIVALGYDESLPADATRQNPDAFSLTELGAEVLRGDLGLAQVVTDRPLVIQPNFEILVLEPHMPALYTLIRFTQPVQFGRASRFRLTREALLRGMSQGSDFDTILHFLQSHSQREMAQNVLYTLTDWARQFNDPQLNPVVVIKVASEAVAAELCASKKLRDLGLRRVGPLSLAASQGAALRSVRRAIERAGFASQASVGTLVGTLERR